MDSAAVDGGLLAAERDPEEPTAAETTPAQPARRRPLWIQVVALLGIYVALSFVNDPRGTLGSDTGAKVATLRVMNDRMTVVPTVGYWAAAQDPDARVHPLLDTLVRDGRYIDISTLPMLLAAAPLYRIGGYRLALLLPMLGAIGCALAARLLARRLRARHPDAVFWIVGLASPVAIYALDLWEHAPGLALMLFGVVKMLDAGDEDGRLRDGLSAGLLFGAAATMRTEAFVYGAIAGAVVFGALVLATRNWRAAFARGSAAIGGVAAMFVANNVLERAVVGTALRSGRTATAAGGVGSTLGKRLHEAGTMTWGINTNHLETISAICVLGFVVLIALIVARNGSQRYARDLVLLLAIPVVVRLVAPAFVPGFMVAFPLAALGAAVFWRDARARLVGIIALAALPVVWYTDFVGGATPQWGGRYILCSSILLGVVGFVVGTEVVPSLTKATAVLGVVITAVGVVYLAQRSHDFGRTGAALASRHEDVLIAHDAFLLREFGAYYTERRPWLTAWNGELVTRALQVADARGARTLGFLTSSERQSRQKLPGWRATGRITFDVSDAPLYYTTYERAP